MAWLAIVAALFNPSINAEDRERLKNIVAVITDKSTSQQLDGRNEQTEAVQKLITERIGKLNNFEVKELEVRDQISQTTDVSTALFQGLKTALQDVPADQVAGAIFITDGQVHDIPKSAKRLGINTPVHALITGRKNEFDRKLTILKAPRFGVVGNNVTFAFKVDEYGRNSGTLDVTVLVDGEEYSVEEVSPGEVN